MNYGIGFLLYLLSMYISDSLTAYIAYLLAGRRMPYRKVFTLQILAVLIQGTAYSAFMFTYHLIENYILKALFHTFEIIIILSWVFFLFRDTDKKKRFFYVSTVFPFASIAAFVTNALTRLVFPDTVGVPFNGAVWSSKRVFLLLATYLLVHGVVAAIIRLVSKTSIWSKLQAFGEYPKLYIPMGTFYFLVYIIFGFGSKFMTIAWLYIAINPIYLALLAVVVLMVSDIKRTENLNAAQNLLLQQQNYINRLESIQREIRTVQHDYKNMLAGLYAQASEGNVDAVKEYIDTKLLRVDETVRDELTQMNQLTRIEIPELKGLIMTKMLEAERDQVSFHIEVMFPVSRAPIATEDLLRCVGILLDNAIEEARTQKGAVVTLLLLQKDGR